MAISDLIQTYTRVVYDRAPLAEVVAQVRFPLLLAIDDRKPADFQDLIISDFPNLKVLEGIQISLGPNVGEAQPARQSRSYVFSNTKTGESVTLAANAVTFTTSAYQDWHTFSAHFFEILAHFVTCYKVRQWNRLGLRYRNVIDREELKISNRQWINLVNPKLLGLFGTPLLEDCTLRGIGSFCQLVIGGITLFIQTGLAEKAGSSEQPFVIDFDLSKEDEATLDIDALRKDFDDMHTYSGPLFRWSITEELHNALGPK